MPNLDSDKTLILLELYKKNHAEITRYRDYEWKITAYIGAIYVWMINTILRGVDLSDASSALAQSLWSYFATALYIFAIFAFWYIHKRLNAIRNDSVRIEHFLGLYDKGFISLPASKVEDLGWSPKEFKQLLSSRGQKIEGFSEGVGVLFILGFFVFVTSLFVYLNYLIFTV